MKRNETIDLIKGLGILAVVLGHSAFPLKSYIYLFHMPIFFMASGYCFNIKNSATPATLGQYAGKKVKGLYVPYVLFNAIFWLSHNLLIRLNICTDNPAFSAPMQKLTLQQLWARLNHCLHFNPGGTHLLAGADWFVLVLFYISLIFAAAWFITSRFKSQPLQHGLMALSGVAALLVGNVLREKELALEGYWTPAITGYSLYVLGFYLRSLPEKVNVFLEKGKYIILVAGIPLLYLAGKYGSISLNVNHFENPLFLVSCSLLGWFWLQAWANILVKIKYVKEFVVYLSKSSLFILFLHFLAFKAVSAIQVLVYKEEAYMLASFPLLRTDGLWWIPYTVAGVLLPVAVKFGWDKLLLFIKNSGKQPQITE